MVDDTGNPPVVLPLRKMLRFRLQRRNPPVAAGGFGPA